LGGIYFQTDQLVSHLDQNYSFLSPTVLGSAKLAPLAPYLPLGTDLGFRQTEHSYAVFASATWHVTKDLQVSPGVRGSWVNKDFNGNLFYATATTPYATNLVPLPSNVVPLASTLGLGTPNSTSVTRSDKSWLPSAKLQYKLTSSAMAYFSYSRGFKSGGFNGADASGIAANLPFAPEHVNAYEVGVKSEMFDRRLLLNLDLFRMNYDNLQVAAQRPLPSGTFVSVVNNAASSRSQGAELQAEWIVTREFRLRAEATYLNARYVDYQNVSPTALQQLGGLKVQDLSGRPTEFSPHSSGSVTATYSRTLPGGYHFTGQLTEIFSSSYYLTGVDDDLARQRSYSRLDARLTFGTPNESWNIDVIGKNLTDRTVLVFAAPMATSLGSFLEEKGEPRNIAVQVRYHF
jgi:outer membrane receptor protein involved in Fe transport